MDDRKLAGLIEPVVNAAGMDLESVRLTAAGRRRVLRVVVDSDHGVRRARCAGDVPYTLEVSSPGVDRPLTEPRTWAARPGQACPGEGSGGGFRGGASVAADADGVTLGLPGGERRFPHADLGAGSVQVEFGKIPDAELDDFSDPELDDPVSDNNTDLGAGGDGH